MILPTLSPKVSELVNTNYKAAKELFVINTEVPTIYEPLFLTLLCIPFVFLYNVIFDCFLKWNIPIADKSWKSIFNNLILDILFVNVVNILAQTQPSSHVPLLLAAVYVSLLLIEFLKRHPLSPEVRETSESCELFQTHSINEKSKPFITIYRGITMTLTVLAILAVDFPIFPRRYAKTYNWGISLMDTGVGLFVVNSGMVSRQLRYKSGWKAIKGALSSVLPLLILALLRTAYVYLSGYQHVISEYGYHWNFFFTLALVAIFSSVCAGFLKNKFIVIITFIITLVGYQYWLLSGGTEYLLNDVRTTLFDQNKEGIMSCFGYFSIYLGGLFIGHELLQDRKTQEWKRYIKTHIMFSCILLLLGYIFSTYVQVSSRRMANAAYVFNVLATSSIYVGLLMIIQYNLPYFHLPLMYQGINNNQLFIFLLANVMTGFVNNFFHTLTQPFYMAYLILFLYTTLITIVSYILLLNNIKIKFW